MSHKYSKQEKNIMLILARTAIEEELNQKKVSFPSIPDHLKEKRACFVTLTINGKLRGCIGHIIPVQELWKDIRENAVAAAFHDPRFLFLAHNECQFIHIEISVLTVPQKFLYSSTDILIKHLASYKPGIILKKGYYEATFLPQVWNEIPDPETFLSELCIKAGLSSDGWKTPGLSIYTYSAEVFNEREKIQ